MDLVRPDRPQCRLRAGQARASASRDARSPMPSCRSASLRRAGAEIAARHRPRRPRGDARNQPSRLPRAALRLRAAGSDAGSAQLAARGSGADVYSARCFGEGPGCRARPRCGHCHADGGTAGTRIVGLDFSPAAGASLPALFEAASGDGRVPHVDTTVPLLIVYTSGTTGHPKGAVLRQEALVCGMRP